MKERKRLDTREKTDPAALQYSTAILSICLYIKPTYNKEYYQLLHNPLQEGWNYMVIN
ncbi:hypothetical protein HanPSC8_Chr17g0775941 [Helianthus annuus]|nr:hypothetical protein HanPSC8_Chr17g0775941 [Helianthus annuus]